MRTVCVDVQTAMTTNDEPLELRAVAEASGVQSHAGFCTYSLLSLHATLCVSLSVCMHVCLSVCLSVCLFLSLWTSVGHHVVSRLSLSYCQGLFTVFYAVMPTCE